MILIDLNLARSLGKAYAKKPIENLIIVALTVDYVEEYRLIVAPRKFDALQCLSEKPNFHGKYASFKNITFSKLRAIVQRQKLYCLIDSKMARFCSFAPSSLLWGDGKGVNCSFIICPRLQFKYRVELFSFFQMKSVKAKCSQLLQQIVFSLCLLYKPTCLQKHFRGRVLSNLEFSSDRLALFKQ